MEARREPGLSPRASGRRALARSLLLHAALFALAWAGARAPAPAARPAPLQIVVSGEPAARARQQARRAGPAPRGQGQAAAPRPSRPGLHLGLAPRGKGDVVTGAAPGGSVPGGGGSGVPVTTGDGYEVARGMTTAEEGEAYPFFDALWRRVDQALVYPKDLVERRVKGEVTVQVDVRADGRFTGRVRGVSGPEPLLNALVAATVVHALRDPLPGRPRPKIGGREAEALTLVLRFDFTLHAPGIPARPLEIAHFKNVLAFRRDALVDPAINQALDRFFTRYMPPIVPIPGGFYIDFVRAYQFVQNLGRPDPEDVRDTRLELMREQWESVVRPQGG